MYPEFITRPDIKVFLPPIGGLTVYICTLITLLSFRNEPISSYSWKPCLPERPLKGTDPTSA